MSSDEPSRGAASNQDQRFHTTHWSVVLAAGKPGASDAAAALEKLCSTYWFPLYAFARRRGHSAEQAADLTQGFFADLLQRRDLRSVDPQKGRFRSFLLASFQHFISNQLDYQRAQKRGGGVQTLSFDFEKADERIQLEPYHEETPEVVFQKEWALALLDRARSAVEVQYVESGRKELFDALQVFLAGDRPDLSYQEVAKRLDKSEGAIKVAVHRLRQQFHRQIRQEIADTVPEEAEIDAEIKDLFEALRA